MKTLSAIATATAVVMLHVGSLSGCSMQLQAQGDSEGPESRLIRIEATTFTMPGVAIEPDDQGFYFDSLGEIFHVHMHGGPAKRIDLGAGWKTSPKLSPDGKYLAFLSDRDGGPSLWVRRIGDDVAPRSLYSTPLGGVHSWSWIDEQSIALNKGRALNNVPSEIGLVRVLDNGIVVMPPRDSSDHIPATILGTLAGKGKLLISRSTEPNLLLELDAQTAIERRLHTGAIQSLEQLAVSPDGLTIGFAETVGGATSLKLLSVTDGRVYETGCALDSSSHSGGSYDIPRPTYAFLSDVRGVVLNRNGQFRKCIFGGKETPIPVSMNEELKLALPAKPKHLGAHSPLLRWPALSPEGGEVAFVNQGRIWTRRVTAGSPQYVDTGPGRAFMPSFDPTGRKLVYSRLQGVIATLEVKDLDTGKVSELRASTDRIFANPAWSPDGRAIAYVDAPRNGSRDHLAADLVRLDIKSGQSKVVDSVYPTQYTNRTYPQVSWAGGDQSLYYVASDGGSTRRLMHQSPTGAPRLVTEFDHSVWEATVSPDGRWIAILSRDAISIAPMLFAEGDKPLITLESAREWRVVKRGNVDYMAWSTRGHLLWSSQDHIEVGSPDVGDWLGFQFRLPDLIESKSASEHQAVAYVGGRIITMNQDQVIEDGVIVTSGGRIRYVGRTIPEEFTNAALVDVRGKTIIPGLVDTHRHIRYSNLEITEEVNHALFANAAYGVTTIYDPAYFTLEAAELSEASRASDYPGSTYYGSGAGILGDEHHVAYKKVASVEDVIPDVERMQAFGSPMIKMYLRRDRNERRAIIAGARSRGVGVSVHEAPNFAVQLGAVQDGASSLEHPVLMNPVDFHGDVVSFLKGSGVTLTPTLGDASKSTVGRFLFEVSPVDAMEECLYSGEPQADLIKDWRKFRGDPFEHFASSPIQTQRFLKSYANLLTAGVRVSVGAHDAPNGIGTHREIWGMVYGGATPMDALRAGTVNGAHKLGLESSVGSLAPGMDADFVVLNSDPLEDIRNSADINFVVKRGRTIEWPSGSEWPLGWNVDASWNACKDANSGVVSQ